MSIGNVYWLLTRYPDNKTKQGNLEKTMGMMLEETLKEQKARILDKTGKELGQTCNDFGRNWEEIFNKFPKISEKF